MTPFRRDCKEIQQSHRKNFLVDCSTVICKEMGKVDIPIYKNKKNIGILRLDNVLISFLASGNNWVHFENNFIHLGIKDGPKIEIPFWSLLSNALIVNNKKERKSNETNKANIKKLKLSTNLLHDRFHRSDGAMATIKAHDLWCRYLVHDCTRLK